MKKTIVLLGLIGIVIIASGQNRRKGNNGSTFTIPGVTTKEYYDYKKTKIKEAITEYPNGDLLSKVYYENGILKQEVLTSKELVSENKCISGKIYDKFGKLERVESRNRKGELDGENKILEYLPDFKSKYIKCYSLHKNGRLIKLKTMYSSTKIKELYDNHVFSQFEENGKKGINIKFDENDNNLIEFNIMAEDENKSAVFSVKFKDGKVDTSEKCYFSNNKLTSKIILKKDSIDSNKILKIDYDSNNKIDFKALFNNTDLTEFMEPAQIKGVDQEKYFIFRIPSLVGNDESNYNHYSRTYRPTYEEHIQFRENLIKLFIQEGKDVSN
ncbi:MAG: hypothetical protein WCJ03_11575 [Bacteroidales bacterium]